jgi:AmpE protein
MRFLIMIICLLSERYIPHRLQKKRQTWLERYIDFLRKIIPENLVNASRLTVYFACLLSLLILCGVMALIKHSTILFPINFAFEFVVFYLCLGEHNLFYMNANSNDHLTIRDYIYAINQEVMAILFWFFVLGPSGAILYRVTLEFAKINSFDKLTLTLCQFLDWLPTRMSAMLFLMVGQFQPGFKIFLQQFNSKPENNHQFLVTIAEQAMHESSLESIQISKLEILFSHACLLLLFIMAVFMIGKVI